MPELRDPRSRREGSGRIVPALFLLTPFLGASLADATGLTFEGLVKAGVEADTNPERLSGEGSRTDTVERLFLELSLASRDEHQAIFGNVRLGGKQFNRTNVEDVFVFDANGTLQRLLLEDLALSVRFYARDRLERGHLRDYVRVGTRAGHARRPDHR